MAKYFAALLFLITPALAQAPAIPAAPVDPELFEQVARALADVPMTLAAHQQVLSVLDAARREAQVRRAKVGAGAPPVALPPPMTVETGK